MDPAAKTRLKSMCDVWKKDLLENVAPFWYAHQAVELWLRLLASMSKVMFVQ